MKRSYLVQRLRLPMKNAEGVVIDNPFCFGGGYVNGGFSKEAWKLVRELTEFDYMGSAEFEFGAVPAAFKMIADMREQELLCFDLIELDNDAKEQCWIICSKNDLPEVKERILSWSKEEPRFKESIGLYRNPNYPWSKTPRSVVGWVELDNGFMFFVDNRMAENFKILFQL